jgi:hypothetical protein
MAQRKHLGYGLLDRTWSGHRRALVHTKIVSDVFAKTRKLCAVVSQKIQGNDAGVVDRTESVKRDGVYSPVI